MNILILQGPNLNLLGLKSSKNDKNLTLDKLNKKIKLHARENDITLRVHQTHKQFQAINTLQRNRNWASGILVIPTSWARNDFTILETLKLINIKTTMVFFEKEFSFGTSIENSILTAKNIKSFSGDPVTTCIEAMEFLKS